MLPSSFSRSAFATPGAARVPALTGAALTAIVIALCRPVSGHAQEAAETVANGPVIIYHAPLDQRSAELRQALVSEDDNYHAKYERRKLSPEERNALNVELREAIRGVYDRQRVTPAQ